MLCATSLDLVNNVWLLVVVFSEDPHSLVLTSASQQGTKGEIQVCRMEGHHSIGLC